MSNRIKNLVSRDRDRKLLIPYLTAGFPSIKETINLASAAADSGCDMLELGLPFSDPLADGPDIQFSSFQALQLGLTFDDIFVAVEKIRKHVDIPLIFMGYYNPLIAHGVRSFVRRAADAGIDGLIIPDLPVEESADFRQACSKQAVSTIFLVAPTSSDERIELIDKNSTGFVYAVTVTGVTGTGKVFDRSTDNYLKKLRSILENKFVAGFGISSAADAQRLGRLSDGVVIGSAIVKLLRQGANQSDRRRTLEKFLKVIRKAI
ncbi:MAG: tryptophan synthase subunit alpha [bacterium]|nr:tryptophan synthase subunit alpha [bacterium]